MAASTDGDVVPGLARRPERVRFHATLRQALPMIAPLLLCGVLPTMELVTNTLAAQRLGVAFFVWEGIGLCAMILAAAFFLARWPGVALTADTVIVYRLGRRAIAWSDICAIRNERQLGAQRIVLYESSGRRTWLRFPVSAPLSRDRQFEQKFSVIVDWWLANRWSGQAVADAAVLGDGLAMAADAEARMAGFSGPPDRLRLLPSAVQRAAVVFALIWVVGYASVTALLAALFSGPVSLPARAVDVTVALAALIGIWLCSSRAGVTLTPGTLVVQRVHRREILWSQVQSVQVVRRNGGRRLVVVEASGRRTLLPAPRIGLVLWDRDFDGRAQVIYRWWLQHRGEDRGPDISAAPESDVLEPTGADRPAFWRMAVLGIAVLAIAPQIAMLPVLAVLAFFSSGHGH